VNIRHALTIIPLVCLAAPGHPAAPSCGETCLLDLATSFIDGVGAADPSGVPLAKAFVQWENGIRTSTHEGIWKTGNGWTYRHTVADPVTGETVTFGVVRDGDKPTMSVVHLWIRGRTIAKAELLVSHEGDFSLFNPGEPHDPAAIFETFLPVDRRDTRETLRKTAKGYFDSLISSDRSKVHFHPDCNRIENGIRTTNGSRPGMTSCSDGVPRFAYMHAYRDMAFPVLDPARGLAVVRVMFDLPLMDRTITVHGKPVVMNAERNHLPRSLYLFEMFRIEDGRIKRIEAILRNEKLGAELPFGGENASGPPIR
jgi:hypothetical protein